MAWQAGELPGKLRGEAEEAGESGACRRGGQEADFSSQAATRKASDDGQKAQPAAFPPQTSLTNAGDRGEEERREEKRSRHNRRTTLGTEQQGLPFFRDARRECGIPSMRKR